MAHPISEKKTHESRQPFQGALSNILCSVMGTIMGSVMGSVVVGHGDGQGIGHEVNIGIGHEVGHGVLVNITNKKKIRSFIKLCGTWETT